MKSTKPEPDPEEPRVDWTPVRQLYDAATKLFDLGTHWQSIQPDLKVLVGNCQRDSPESEILITFRGTLDELTHLHRHYMDWEHGPWFIPKYRALSDA